MNSIRKIFLAGLVVLAGFQLQAQQAGGQSLQQQFDDMLKQSNRYQDYKVVKIAKLNQYQQNLQDTLDQFRADYSSDQATKANQQRTIDSLQANKLSLETSLQESKAKEEGISFFGTLMKKGTYKMMMWASIGILLLALIALLMGYRNRAAVTKALSLKLSEVEAEFETHRQRSLEREQQIRRKLQDEINKNKKE